MSMKNTFEYKGYFARIELEEEDNCFSGRIAAINDVVDFYGTSIDELRSAFQDSVDDYLAACKQFGKNPDKPYSGKMMFRVDPKIHASAARAAQLKGISLNQWAEEVLREAAS